MPRYSIVIPAYNEEHGIRIVLEKLLHNLDAPRLEEEERPEILVVDDGSTDDTANVARHFRDVRVISHEKNLGYGAALKNGFKAAGGEYIAFLDADGSYPAERLPELFREIAARQADMVIGSRMSGSRSRMPRLRHVGNLLYAGLLSWIVEGKVSDAASGMRVFRKSVLPRLMPLPNGLELTPCMSTRALLEGLRVVEIPIPYRDRIGPSKLNILVDGYRFLFTILNTARLYNPLKFFGAMGAVLLVLAAALFVQPTAFYLRHGFLLEGMIYRFFAVLVIAETGVSILMFGALSNAALAAIHGTAPQERSWVVRVPFYRVWAKYFWLAGPMLVVIALAFASRPIFEFVRARQITAHWSYVAAAATFLILGLQLMMTDFLLRTIREVRTRYQDEPSVEMKGAKGPPLS